MFINQQPLSHIHWFLFVSYYYENSFDDILDGLEEQFFHPRRPEGVPALRVRGDHDLFRQPIAAKRLDDVARCVKRQPLTDPLILMNGNSVADADLMPIPATPRVRKVEYLAEVCIEVRFEGDA